jgi:serine phosphatase RsbU (regulator of sigma subunit)
VTRGRLFATADPVRTVAGVLVVLVGAPLAVLLTRNEAFSHFLGLPFLIVVAAATLLGRLWVGLFAAAVSAVLLNVYVVSSVDLGGGGDVVSIVFFVGVCVVLALVLARLEGANEERTIANHRLLLITRVADVLVSSLDNEVMMREVARLLVTDVADMCILHTLAGSPFGETVASAARRPESLETVAELQARYPSAPGDRGAIDRVLQSGETVLMADVSDERLAASAVDAAHLALLRRLAVRSVIVAPVKAGGDVLGTLSLSRMQGGRRFAEPDVELAHQIADRVALAMTNAELYQEARIARARVALVSRVSELLAQELHYPAAFDRLAELLAAEMADLVLIDALTPSGGIERVVALHADPAKQSLADILLNEYGPTLDGDRSVARVVRGGAPEYASEMPPDYLRRMTRDDRHFDVVTELGFRSFMCLPLEARGHILGVLTLVSTSLARTYRAEDLEVGMEIARRAGVRIDNARLYEEQHRIARTLQASLLPKELPSIPDAVIGVRYWAAGEGIEVGGDFYDVFPGADGSWTLLIGDVSGKGAEAAAVIGLVRHTVRALAARPITLQALFENLNETLLADTPEGRFATLCVARVARRETTMSLTLATGGHPPPYLVAADGTVRPIRLKGTPLGLLGDTEIGVVSADLEPGDTLVLYTDGIVERPEGEAERTRDISLLLRGAHEGSVEEMLTRIEAEIAPDSLLDDAALLALRFQA